jgi:hypothetical protein
LPGSTPKQDKVTSVHKRISRTAGKEQHLCCYFIVKSAKKNKKKRMKFLCRSWQLPATAVYTGAAEERGIIKP